MFTIEKEIRLQKGVSGVILGIICMSKHTKIRCLTLDILYKLAVHREHWRMHLGSREIAETI